MANAQDEKTIGTEAEAFAELIRWGRGRCAWQQDALALLIAEGELSGTQIDTLEAVCLRPELGKDLLNQSDLESFTRASKTLSLLSIENPTGVNALANDQRLALAEHGLSIVYGDNGAGKSGYVRILKNACRSRDGDADIVNNLDAREQQPQSAQIHYSIEGSTKAVQWTPSDTGIGDLPLVSIFDSKSANIHVEKTNEVAYVPTPMRVLQSLAECCDTLKARIVARISELQAQTPLALKEVHIDPTTVAGAFLRDLSATSNKAELVRLASLDDTDTRRMEELKSTLAQTDDKYLAALRRQYQAYCEFVERSSEAHKSTAGHCFAARDALLSEQASTAAAAVAASEELFSQDGPTGVGQEAWLKVWEAARDFSDSMAYPDAKFPALDKDVDRCPLCHQSIDRSVLDRWMSFEEYVKGTTKTAASNAAAAVATWREDLADRRMTIVQIRALMVMISDEFAEEELSKVVRRALVIGAWRHRALRRDLPRPTIESSFPSASLEALARVIAKRIEELSLEDKSPEKLALRAELAELLAREKLSLVRADVDAQIDRLGEIQKLKTAQRVTKKNAITNKNNELTDQIVTNALRGQFAREISSLKLTAAPVELRKDKVRSAVSYFRVSLIEHPDCPVGKIFSEGEHRCVALAGFLAELITSKDASAVVFDDPMSSLDHIHRKSVAARLAEEAKYRQVVVFTHDLTFLYELRREAQSRDVDLHYQTVRSRDGVPGHVESGLPTKAKSASERVTLMFNLLKSVKGQVSNWDELERNVFVKGFLEQLRESWEQGVADVIHPVLARFDNAVKAGSLHKLEVLNRSDVEIVAESRGRLSGLLHAASESMNQTEVTIDQLKNEVKALDDWLKDIYSRQKAAEGSISPFSPPSN
ncbi:MAG: AAA family ATPase [Cyanobacteria bacterium J06642_2]